MRVPQFTAKHLHAATDSNDFSAISEVSEQIGVPAVLPEPKEASVYILAARQDDQVRCRRRGNRPYIAEINLWMRPKRFKVGVIAQVRQCRYNDHERLACCRSSASLCRQVVFLI